LQTGPPAPDAEAPPVDIAAPVDGWDDALTRIEADLAKPALDEEALDELRQQLSGVQQQIADFISAERPRLPEIEARYQALGEAPKDGAPSEPEPVAEQRRELRKALGDLTGTLKAADEAALRSRLLAAEARELRRNLFGQRILERGRSPLSPSLWRDIAADAPIGLTRIGHMLGHWWQTPDDKRLFLGIVAAAAALLVLLSYLGQ
jgi:small-conductance mechanosensitive channel